MKRLRRSNKCIQKSYGTFYKSQKCGEIENADGIGEVEIQDVRYNENVFKIEDEVIVDVKFKTFGCGSAMPHLVWQRR